MHENPLLSGRITAHIPRYMVVTFLVNLLGYGGY